MKHGELFYQSSQKVLVFCSSLLPSCCSVKELKHPEVIVSSCELTPDDLVLAGAINVQTGKYKRKLIFFHGSGNRTDAVPLHVMRTVMLLQLQV